MNSNPCIIPLRLVFPCKAVVCFYEGDDFPLESCQVNPENTETLLSVALVSVAAVVIKIEIH